ncbi:MAG: PAS domain-containing sensor histidine kinase, partial [Anaerolineae bacterium]
LQQVFTNIIANGLQAMPDGGRLGIKSAVEDGRWAVITVTDTGEGISEQDRAKLFEPLFTTRTKGIGLGLALAKKFVEAHKGAIHLQSSPGKGAMFSIKLPLIVQTVARRQADEGAVLHGSKP